MENNGRYIVLLKNELFRINYIEKGYTRDLSLIDDNMSLRRVLRYHD